MSLTSQLADYQAILAFAREEFGCRLTVVAESAGATVAALDWNRPEVQDYALLWPAFDLRDTDLRPFFSPAKLRAVLDAGMLDDSGVILGRQYYEEILATDFTPCFRLPEKDVFLAHGRQDAEVPFKQSLRAFESSPGLVTFLAHPSAGHGFKVSEFRATLLNALTAWLCR